MQTGEQDQMGREADVFLAYVECLKTSLPLVAAALFAGQADGVEWLRSTTEDPAERHALTNALGVPGERVNVGSPVVSKNLGPATGGATVAVLLAGAPSALELAVFDAVTGLMEAGLAHQLAALKAEREQTYFRHALETLPEAIAVFDRDERFVFWNRTFEETYGAGVELQLGRTFEDHLRACLRTGAVKDAIGREAEWLANRLERFRTAQGAHEHALSSGRWVRTQDRILPGGGRIGIRSDITEFIQREQSFRLLFDSSPTPMLIIDRETLDIRAVNDASASFYGYEKAAMETMRLPDIRPEKVDGEIRSIIDRLDSSEIMQKPRIHIGADGQQRIVRVNTRFIEYRGRECILAAVFDMTDRYRAEEEILKTRRFLRDVVDHVPLALFVKDMENDGRYVLYNKAGEHLFGQSHAQVIGNNDAHLFNQSIYSKYQMQDVQVLRQGMLDLVEDQVEMDGSSKGISLRLRKVALNDSATGRPRYVLGLAEDVTEQRNREAEISLLALHDSLTGLPNRRAFDERLRAGLAALEPGMLQAILFLDLDGFKAVNDSFGHGAGDRLLQMVAQRLQDSTRPQDTVARFGGDEFAVIAEVRHEQEAGHLAARIVSTIAMPYEHEGRELSVSASIGISYAPRDGSMPHQLVSKADAALYEAKRAGKGRFAVWSREGAEADWREGLDRRAR